MQDPRGTWTTEALEEAIEAIEVRRCSMRRVSRSWNIPLNFLCVHLNKQTRSKKMGLGGVFKDGENDVVVVWVLAMQEIGMSIIMHQLKMKVAKLT